VWGVEASAGPDPRTGRWSIGCGHVDGGAELTPSSARRAAPDRRELTIHR
jgi:hypothetical protein